MVLQCDFFYLLKYCCVCVLCIFFLFLFPVLLVQSRANGTILSVNVYLEILFFIRNWASLFSSDIVTVFRVTTEMNSEVNGNWNWYSFLFIYFLFINNVKKLQYYPFVGILNSMCARPEIHYHPDMSVAAHCQNAKIQITLQVSNKCIAVRKVATPLWELTCHMGSQCYLPPGRGDIPALTPAKAGTRLRDPKGCKAELT